jgi:hypothetical protein
MKKQLIHNKQLNKITAVKFSYNDVTITQDGHLVVLDKYEILELAQLITNEINDQEFYRNRGIKNHDEKRGKTIN